ncbi:MAG: FkbM family methyltransferase [Pseudomonadota bacterium]
MKRRLARFIRSKVSNPEIYGLMRSAMLLWQRVLRRPDEPDLRLLARVPEQPGELVLDIGANGGQSAMALSFLRPKAQILSYEPLPMLWPELKRVRRFIGKRFDFRRYGLGTSQASATIYVPVAGRLPITTRASLLEEEARSQCAQLARETGLETSISQVDIEIRKGDDEGLAPLAIKLDVEGAERLVLDGLAQTIDTHRPVMLIEYSDSFDACAAYFSDRDYTIYVGEDRGDGTLICPDLSNRNWIAAPSEQAHLFAT